MDFLTKNKLVERYIFLAPWRTCVFLHANHLRYLICVHTDTPVKARERALLPRDTYTCTKGQNNVGCTDFHAKQEKKKKATTKLHLITAVDHVAPIRPDSGEFFNPRQIRVTGSTARGLCTFVSRDSIGIVARPIEIADRDRDSSYSFFGLLMPLYWNWPARLFLSTLRGKFFLPLFFCFRIFISFCVWLKPLKFLWHRWRFT